MNGPAVYQITVEGQLGPCWRAWFGAVTVTPLPGGTTLLTVPLADQAALFGLLRKVRDLGMVLVALRTLPPAAGSPDQTRTSAGVDQTMESLVTSQWLHEQLTAPDLVVLDCTVRVTMDKATGYRVTNGRAGYEAGHIPGAGFADLLGSLAGPGRTLWTNLPTAAQFCQAIGALGVGDASRVVLYDADSGVWAARVWWMLRWVGFDRAALLDGGLAAWQREGRPLSTAAATTPPRQLTLRLRPEMIADRDEVRAAIGRDDVQIVYTLDAASYVLGHIPGAQHVDVRALFNDDAHFRPPAELAGVHPLDPAARVITYCGGGVAASANAFALTRLGYLNVAVYAGSLQEWTADPANPLVGKNPDALRGFYQTGSQTGAK